MRGIHIALHGGLSTPFQSFLNVLFNAHAASAKCSKTPLSFGIALLSSLAIPLCRFHKIRNNAASAFIHHSEATL